MVNSQKTSKCAFRWDYCITNFCFISSRLQKVQRLQERLGSLVLTLTPKKLVLVGSIMFLFVFEKPNSRRYFIWMIKWSELLLWKWLCCFLAGEKFGITEFVNPKDYEKPIQEVAVIPCLLGWAQSFNNAELISHRKEMLLAVGVLFVNLICIFLFANVT